MLTFYSLKTETSPWQLYTEHEGSKSVIAPRVHTVESVSFRFDVEFNKLVVSFTINHRSPFCTNISELSETGVLCENQIQQKEKEKKNAYKTKQKKTTLWSNEHHCQDVRR